MLMGNVLIKKTNIIGAGGLTLVLLTCFKCIFRHLKLELLTWFPSSNDEKYDYLWKINMWKLTFCLTEHLPVSQTILWTSASFYFLCNLPDTGYTAPAAKRLRVKGMLAHVYPANARHSSKIVSMLDHRLLRTWTTFDPPWLNVQCLPCSPLLRPMTGVI